LAKARKALKVLGKTLTSTPAPKLSPKVIRSRAGVDVVIPEKEPPTDVIAAANADAKMSDGNNANIDNKDSNGANKNADEFDNMEINKI
jgi:hypothetical protein